MKKLALALGGGASKGYAHIGILKVLEDNGIKPDLIVGTSMGAVIGGVYASGKNYEYITNICKQLTKKNLMDFNLLNVFFNTGIMSGKKLKKLLQQEIGSLTHEDTKIPFAAVATDIEAGELVVLNEGLVVDSILASSAIPGIFPLANDGTSLLCDGGLLNNVPDDIARQMAKDYVIMSVDVIGEYSRQVETSKIKIAGLTLNALTLMQTQITKLRSSCSDLRIVITQPDVEQMSFDRESVEKSIQYGISAMEKNVKKLKKLLQD